jgi:hypothetical protein
MTRWWAFVRERFPLASCVPMALAFGVANALALAPVAPSFALAVCVLALAFFLRLRVLDELKDLGLDRVVHPERPLARGLIAPAEARRAVRALLCVEAAAATLGGWPLLAGWLPAAAYSLLMAREFFVGAWLRPRVELYAVTHTAVAALLGSGIAAAAAEGAAGADALAALGCANWMAFNVFELARKVLAPSEERPGVDSYSGRLGPGGAAGALTAIGWCAVVAASTLALPAWSAALHRTLAGLVGGCALAYACAPSVRMARGLRTCGSLFVAGFYVTIAAGRYL